MKYKKLIWWPVDAADGNSVVLTCKDYNRKVKIVDSFKDFKKAINKKSYIVCSIENIDGYLEGIKILIESHQDYIFHFVERLDNMIPNSEEYQIFSIKNNYKNVVKPESKDFLVEDSLL